MSDMIAGIYIPPEDKRIQDCRNCKHLFESMKNGICKECSRLTEYRSHNARYKDRWEEAKD